VEQWVPIILQCLNDCYTDDNDINDSLDGYYEDNF